MPKHVMIDDNTSDVTLDSQKMTAGSAHFGDSSNYIDIATDGTLTLAGSATTYDDLFVPLTTTKLGATNLPHFDETNVGYLFPQNDTSEKLYMTVQMPHRWKEGSPIFPHVHFRQGTNGVPVYKINYKWHSISNQTTSNYVVYTMSTPVATYVSGTIHQICRNSTGIDGTGQTFSSILSIKLYRDDNSYPGDSMTDQFDLHYEIDSFGTKTEYTK